MDSSHYYCDVMYYNKEILWICDDEKIRKSEGIRILSTIMNDHMKMGGKKEKYIWKDQIGFFSMLY